MRKGYCNNGVAHFLVFSFFVFTFDGDDDNEDDDDDDGAAADDVYDEDATRWCWWQWLSSWRFFLSTKGCDDDVDDDVDSVVLLL